MLCYYAYATVCQPGLQSENNMATIEQVRAREEEIVNRFQSQPVRRGQFSEVTRRAVVDAVQAPHSVKARDKSKNALPAPSEKARDFIVRAISNPSFRRLIERLANE